MLKYHSSAVWLAFCFNNDKEREVARLFVPVQPPESHPARGERYCSFPGYPVALLLVHFQGGTYVSRHSV
jgi:hypothetical protein